MKTQIVACVIVMASQVASPSAQERPPGGGAAISLRTGSVEGVTLSYLTAGRGPAIVLLHGYAETSRMWRPLIPKLSTRFTVIAPDLPGIGGSAIPSDGIDMSSAARRIHGLITQLGISKAQVVGHDIGLMVAYAYAAQFPTEVEKLVLMDAFLPGVDGWESIYNDPRIWHFRFNGPTAELLVRGRERTYFEHFWNDFAADKTRSIPEAERQAYVAAYARPGRMRAAWSYFVSFQKAATDFAQFSRTKLTMPVMSIGGDKANGDTLAKQLPLVATNTKVVTLRNTGHGVLEENPRDTMAALLPFLGVDADRSALPPLRMTPAEVRANQTGTEQIGSSGLAVVSTKGWRETVAAHSHRDDRTATVVSGN